MTAVLEWNERLALGQPKMDEIHREFVDLVNAAAAADDASLVAALDALIAHTAAHFEAEDRWMRLTGWEPPCHPSEHARVLAIARDVRQRVAAGDLEIGRVLAAELGPWFEHHAGSMDTILAAHLESVGFDPATESFPEGRPRAEAACAGGSAAVGADADGADAAGPAHAGCGCGS